MPRLRNGALPDSQTIVLHREKAPRRGPTLREGGTLTSRQIAITMAQTALKAKAEDVVILDLRKLSFSFDFFVLCSASSDRRMLTIAEEIEERLSPHPILLRHREGQNQGGWILLDYGPVVTHIFSPELRQFYGLERLWADAPTVSVH